MKRKLKNSFILLLLIVFTGCTNNSEMTTVINGKYILQSNVEANEKLPYINISDNEITFYYDPLSSYIPIGTYIIRDNLLMMKTNDEKYNYTFQIKGDVLIFQEDMSSEIKLTNEKFGNNVVNNAEFKINK